MNAHIQPFYQGGQYFSFYPYYMPKYYSNYYPRHYNRYYEPVSTVTIKRGPITVQNIPEPEIFQKQHFLVVFFVLVLFLIVAFRTLRA